MKVNAIKQKNVSFKSKILFTNTLGFGVNRAVELGDKGFFNALKHLSNDGLAREIIVSGSNSAFKNFISSTTTLHIDKLKHSSKSSQIINSEIDGFQLMGENVIELIKRLAKETGNISKEVLEQKSTKSTLVKEGNEVYRTIFVG